MNNNYVSEFKSAAWTLYISNFTAREFFGLSNGTTLEEACRITQAVKDLMGECSYFSVKIYSEPEFRGPIFVQTETPIPILDLAMKIGAAHYLVGSGVDASGAWINERHWSIYGIDNPHEPIATGGGLESFFCDSNLGAYHQLHKLQKRIKSGITRSKLDRLEHKIQDLKIFLAEEHIVPYQNKHLW
jgi:hypothetical protein